MSGKLWLYMARYGFDWGKHAATAKGCYVVNAMPNSDFWAHGSEYMPNDLKDKE